RVLSVKQKGQRGMDLGIKGRRAIVTGGGSGIGYETARVLLEEGARVLIAGRTADKIDKARDELARKTGGEVHAVQADMTKEADIKRMVETATTKLGGVDILINNAGTMYSGRFAVLDDNELVNAICPGWVDTNLWKRNAEGLRQELGVKSEDEARKLAAKKNSLGRMGKPEELANATVFLCSERASYITGVSLNMDGGRLKGLW